MNMKIKILMGFTMVLFLCGCSTSEQLAKNLSGKSIVGDGTYIKSTIGIDAENKIPTINTVFIDGSFVDVKANQNFFDLSVKKQSSVWNAEASTLLIRATLQTNKKEDMRNSIDKITQAFKAVYGANKQ